MATDKNETSPYLLPNFAIAIYHHSYHTQTSHISKIIINHSSPPTITLITTVSIILLISNPTLINILIIKKKLSTCNNSITLKPNNQLTK